MSVQQLSARARLAQAAYTALSANMPTNSLESAIQAPGGSFTATQAQSFAARHSVVLQYHDHASLCADNGVRQTLRNLPSPSFSVSSLFAKHSRTMPCSKPSA